MSAIHRAFAFVIVACLAALFASAEEKKGSDANKLPVGSIWDGTCKITLGKEVATSRLTLKITKREGNKFEGEWRQFNKPHVPEYEMEGTIAANNRVTINLVKQISGKGRDDKIANTKITGQLANDELEGTAFIPETKWSMVWNVKLKKD